MIMKPVKSIISAGCFTLAVLLSACSSHIPPEIKQPLDGAPSVPEVRGSASEHISKNIRWGGVILGTENKAKSSWVTVLAFPLNSYGEPQKDQQSQGRFIAVIDQFLEPTVYSHDRKITVTGKLLRTETQKVGEFPYEYPIVQVEQFYLWQPDPEPSPLDRYPYWWYDPWYDPFYYPHHHYH